MDNDEVDGARAANDPEKNAAEGMGIEAESDRKLRPETRRCTDAVFIIAVLIFFFEFVGKFRGKFGRGDPRNKA